MPREPRKIDPDEMALYQARYCEEYEETETKLVVYPEDKVVKPIDKSAIHEDDWPMFVLKDTMPVGEGGKIVNILLAVRDKPNFKVTGRVIVDNDMKPRLCTFRGKSYKNLNGASIQLREPDNIAIGFDPTTIWIASESGWFEVQPACEYREAFERVNHVINFFFLAVDHSEEIAKLLTVKKSLSTVRKDVEEVLFRYVNFIGSGATILEIIDALRESRDYILNQFQKKMSSEYYVAGNKNLKWTDSNVYRWVYAGLPLDMPNILPADPVMALTKPPPLGSFVPVTAFKPNMKRSPTPPKRVEVSAPKVATPPPPQKRSPGPLASVSAQTITSKKTKKEDTPKIKAHHGEYISPQFPQGMLADFDNVERIVAVAFHAMHTKRQGTEMGLNMSKLRNCVYVDHAFDRSQASYQIFHYYAKKVAARLLELDPSLKDSTLYEELSKAPSTYPATLTDIEKQKVAEYTTAKPPQVLKHRTTLGHLRKSPVRKDSSPPVPAPSIGNVSSAMDTMCIISGSERAGTTNGKRTSNSPPATKSSKKQKLDTSIVSRSCEASPVPSGPAPVKLDSLGKAIPKRVKRYY